MATITAQILQNHNNNNDKEVNREEIKAAIAKAVELRALHASLMQSTSSPSNLRFSSAVSPVSHPLSQYSAHDYPVFTPSYEGEPMSGYQQLQLESQSSSECWDEYLGRVNASSRKGIPCDLILNSEEPHVCPLEEDQKSVAASSNNLARASPGADYHKSSRRRNSLGDLNSVSSCNRCKPAVVISSTGLVENGHPKNTKYSNTVVPLTDSHASVQSQAKGRGLSSFSRLFTRLKKKQQQKIENSPNRTEATEEGSSQILKEFGIMSAEALKRELMVASEGRDAALMEAAEMKSSVGELKQRMECLETYCEELKKALNQSAISHVGKESKEPQFLEKKGNFPRRGKGVDGNGENAMPVSEEVMVEGFLQIVSEARLSVKQFCKTLVSQIEETDNTLMENLNTLLQPYKLSMNSKYSKVVLYHLEAVINQSLYQDFENCVFQKNGSPKILDPQQDRQSQFSSFVSLRNLSWNEVLRKGTRYYSEEFSKFCDQKMSYIITTLNWTRPWPEQLLQAFFVAAKCIWLLHLLAFSFNPPLGILRVEENRGFDSQYMEDILMDKQRSQSPSKVKIMVLPGFYVQDRILRCKVLCKYKSVA